MIYIRAEQPFSDASFVDAFQRGDKRKQGIWYQRCSDQFQIGTSGYGGLTTYDRENLFQDSFIILWEKMESRQLYISGREVHVISKKGDKTVPDLMGYFMRIVKNKYLEMFHSDRYTIPINEVITGYEGDFLEELYWDEDPEVMKDRLVSKCLLSLPKSCLEILTKFYYENKTLEEILEERPENNSYDGLKSRKSKCMGNLKKQINESFAKAGLKQLKSKKK